MYTSFIVNHTGQNVKSYVWY